jgi:hypothetical protein
MFVMPGFMPGIHAFLPSIIALRQSFFTKQDVDGRDKPGHDIEGLSSHTLNICA